MVFIFNKTKNALNILILSKYTYRYILFFKFSNIIKSEIEYSLKLTNKIVKTLDVFYLSTYLNKNASTNKLSSFLKGNLHPILQTHILYARYQIAKIAKERLINSNKHFYKIYKIFSNQFFGNIIYSSKISLDIGILFNYQIYFLNILKNYFLMVLLFNIF
jgi:hypothetical protein